MQLFTSIFGKLMPSLPLLIETYIHGFTGYEARFAVHVDDILASVAEESVHAEFSHLFRKKFGQDRVTECASTWILVTKVDHDRENKTITLSQGAYVRKWCPELAHLPDKWIYDPSNAPAEVLQQAGVILGETYPEPIVDHKEARTKALNALEAIKMT